MKLIFVRHGQDDDSRRGGWSQYGLLEEGHIQAKAVADFFRSQRQYAISDLYSSDLKRSMETAAYLSEALELPIRPDPGLRETNNGVLAGMPNAEALARYPGLFFSALAMDEAYPGGESPREFYSRIRRWFSAFVDQCRNNEKDVLVVTHGGVIKVIYHLVNQMEWSNQSNTVPTDKCSIHVLNVDTMTWEVKNQIVW